MACWALPPGPKKAVRWESDSLEEDEDWLATEVVQCAAGEEIWDRLFEVLLILAGDE